MNLISASSLKSFASRPVNWGKCVVAVGTAYFVYKTLLIYVRRRRFRHIPGPTATGILGFYFGHMFESRDNLAKGKLFPEILYELHEQYGEVVKLQFLDEILVSTTNKEAIREALVTKNYPKDVTFNKLLMFPLGERFVGYGLLTEPDHTIWKNRRALFNPGFHRNVLMTFVKQFNSIANTLLEKLRQTADGKTIVPLFNEFNRATLDAIAMIAFDLHTNSVMDPNSKLNSYLAHIIKLTNEQFINPILQLMPSRSKEVRQFREEIRHIRKMGRDRILESIEMFKNNDTPSVDILSSILKSAKETNIDVETMIDDFMTFFFAGQETTANALAFAFLELGRHPEIVQKAREEIDKVLGERSEINYQDVNDLKYCSAIFKETLRLYPPVPNINRRVSDELSINGYHIPKGSLLMISTFVNARLEKFFKDPYEFKPERFLKEVSENDESKIEFGSYLPFSLGPRNCIGMNFAQLEGVIIIAKMVQNFDLQLDPDQSFLMEQSLTLRPKDGTRCNLTIRK